MAATYEPIASQTLASNSTSLTFSSIPSDYTDLMLMYWVAATTESVPVSLRGQFNSDSGGNYSVTNLRATSGSVFSARTTNETFARVGEYGSRLKTSGNTGILHIMSYANTNVYKTFLLSFGNVDAEVLRNVGLWRSTAAISSIYLYSTQSNSFASGSTFSLFGIKAA